jgi:hemerythrin-like metal-binding protein
MWTDVLSVGVKEFDEDHKRLIRMINEMHGVLQNADEKGEIPEEEIEIALHRLQNYFNGHCHREELAMAKAGYPDLEAHREEHQKFIAVVTEMSFHYQGSKSAQDGRDMMQFMYDWLTNHIFVTDRKYTQHLRSKGIL